MTPVSLSVFLIALLDAIALFSLMGTAEIAPWVFIASGSFAATTLLLRTYLKRRFILPNVIALSCIFALMGFGVYLWKKSGLHPLFAVSHIAPLILSLLWVSFKDRLNRSWRLGMGFICLILAASLTPELYMPFSILFFLLISSLLISVEFLNKELGIRNPELTKKPLPAKFIRGSLWRSSVILLSSLLIFPILPRPKGIWKTGFGPAKQDYTEDVDLSSWLKNSNAGKGEPRLRIFIPDENKSSITELAGYFPDLLIRGRTLELFDGTRWLPAKPTQSKRTGIPYGDYDQRRILNIIREPLSSNFLPVPYNTLAIGRDSSALPGLVKNNKEEWHMIYRLRKRLQYKVFLKEMKRESKNNSVNIEDPVEKYHLEVPAMLSTSKWKDLLNEIKGPLKKSDPDFSKKLANQISAHFRKSDFKSNLDFPEQTHKNPLEKFMFEIKDGHCELFAGSTATLLRLAGIPTRLVAGFRISSGPSRGVITLRSGDAHAWVEFWSESKKRWLRSDPTPMRAADSNGTSEFLVATYEVMTAYWYRYILSFDQQNSIKVVGQELSSLGGGIQKFKDQEFFGKITKAVKNIEFVLIIVIFGVLFIFSIYIIYKFRDSSLKFKRKNDHLNSAKLNELDKKRRKMEKLLFKKGFVKKEIALPYRLDRIQIHSNLPESSSKELNKWFTLYEKLRFGPDGMNFREKSFELNILYKKFKASLA